MGFKNVVVLSVVGILFYSNAVFAHPGELDPTFGSQGKQVVTTSVRTASATRLQADGKIVTLKNYQAPPPNNDLNNSFSLSRQLTDGTLDPSFRSTQFSMGGGSAWGATDFILQEDGKIIVAATVAMQDQNGTWSYRMGVWRFLPNGDPDTSFGSLVQATGLHTGKAIGQLNGYPIRLALQANGKFLVSGIGFPTPAGAGLPWLAIMEQFTERGELDSSFHAFSQPLALSVNPPEDSFLGVIKVYHDNIFASWNSRDYGPKLFKLAQDGNLERTYPTSGFPTTTSGTTIRASVINDLALQADDKLVITGCYGVDTNVTCDGVGLERYNADGTIDNNFRTDIVRDNGIGQLVRIQPNGQILVEGESYGDGCCGIWRYQNTGLPDYNFGLRGVVSVDFQENAYSLFPAVAKAIEVDNLNRILATWVASGTHINIVKTRLLPNGTGDLGVLLTASPVRNIVIPSGGSQRATAYFYTFEVRNLGTEPTSDDVALEIKADASFALMTGQASQGTCSSSTSGPRPRAVPSRRQPNSGQAIYQLNCKLGRLPKDGRATVRLSVTRVTAGTGTVNISAQVSGGSDIDLQKGNDMAKATLPASF